MNRSEWENLGITQHIENVVVQYAKIKDGFTSEREIQKYYDAPRVTNGLEIIIKELLQMKKKIENFEKEHGLN